MYKKLLQLKTLLVALLVMAGAGNVWADEVTYTVTSTSAVSISGNAPMGSSAIYSSTYSTEKQLTKGNSMTLTLSGYAGKKITGLVLSMRSNSKGGAGNLSVKAGNTTIASIATAPFNDQSWNNSWSTSYVDKAVTISNDSYVIQNGEKVVITIAATANSLYCESFKLTYEGGGDTPILETSDLTLSPVSLSFDLYDEGDAKSVSFTTSSTGAVTVSESEYVTTSVSGNTITVTPVKITPSAQTITVSQAADGTYYAGTKTFTVYITDSTPVGDVSEDVIDFTAQSYTNQQTIEKFEADGCTISFDKGTNSNAPKYFTSGTAIRAYGGNTFTVTSTCGKSISEIIITFGNSDGSNEITANVGTYSDGTWTGDAESVTFTIGGTSGNRRIAGIEVTYADAGDTRVATTTTFPQASYAIELGDEFTAPTATVKVGEEEVTGAEVTYSGDNDALAAVDATTGSLTFVDGATGEINVTATYAGDETNYKSSTGTYILTVTDPNAPGTENKPYTVAEARAAIDAGTGMTGVYAKGIVSEIVTAYNSQYGNITYNISADGTTTADQLQAYRGKSYNGESFTSEDDIQVGDEVVVYGNLKKYGETYEFDASNQLVSLKRPVVAVPTIGLSTTTVNAEAAGANGTITVTYNNITTVVSEVKFYDADGTTGATYDWIEAEIDTNNNVYYLIGENSGVARTAYLKVYALDDDANDVYSDLIVITQDAPDYASLPFDYDGNGPLPQGLTQNGLGTYTTSLKMKFDNTGDYLVLKLDEEPGALSYDIKGNLFSGGTFTVQTSSNGESFTDLATYTKLDDTQNEFFGSIPADTRYIKWVYTEKSSGNVALGNIYVAKPITAKINAYGYGTFASASAVMFSAEDENLTAWQVKGVDETEITFEQVTGNVAAGTGLLLKGSEGTITVTAANEGEDISDTNILVGITSATKVEENQYYGLSGNTFVPVNAGTVPAGKALLPSNILTSGSGEVRAYTFVFVDPTTGISETQTVSAEQFGEIFNLAGQRVGQPQKGVNIINGKKVLVK